MHWLWIMIRSGALLLMVGSITYTVSIIMAVMERVRAVPNVALKTLRPHILLISLSFVGWNLLAASELIYLWSEPPTPFLPFICAFCITGFIGQRALYRYEVERIRKGE